VSVGDFYGDGIQDLAVANNLGPTVSILLGEGNGAFGAPVNYAVGNGPTSVAVGDFDHDGTLDLAVATGAGVNVLLGNGDGTFQPAVTYVVGVAPASIAVGDFNGDGFLDLVTANEGTPPHFTGTLSVLLGNGDGTFQSARNFPAGTQPTSVAVADFNGDGIPDLVTGSLLLLGNGDGTFRPAVPYGGGGGAVTVADFNGDGIPDLAVNNLGRGTVSILLGNGDSSFRAAGNFAAGPEPLSVAVGDFNGDGIADLVVGQDYSFPVAVLVGNGDGTFQAPLSYEAGAYPHFVAVGDFNGDGSPDVAVANDLTTGTVTVLLNAADWDGGPPLPRSQPQRSDVTAGPPLLDAVAAASTDPEPLVLPQRPLTSTGLPTNPAPRAPVERAGDGHTPSGVASTPRPLVRGWHPEHAVFERWGEPVGAALPWDPV
jgi:hypothetical protein